MTVDPTTFDLEMGVYQGNDLGMLAMLEAVRRYGAKDLEFGYDWPEETEPPPESDVRWYARATFPAQIGKRRSEFTREGEAWAGPSHDLPHDLAVLHAMADLIRKCGGNVTLVDA